MADRRYWQSIEMSHSNQTNKQTKKLAIAVTQKLCTRKPTIENEKLYLGKSETEEKSDTHTLSHSEIHMEKGRKRENKNLLENVNKNVIFRFSI